VSGELASFGAWVDTIRVLEDQLDVLQSLLELAQSRAELMAGGNVRGLELLSYREESLLARCYGLEDTRTRLHDSLGLCGLTLRELESRAPEEIRERLETLTPALERASSGLRRQVQLDRELLHQALYIVNYQLSLLNGSGFRPQLDCRA